jgi:2'-5' RNA ligase
MNTTAMIAFLPANAPWCKQDFPHMTLVYAGDIEGRDKTEFNNMGKDAITAARAIRTFTLTVTEVRELGDQGEEVDALIFYPTPQLLVARKMVESWNQSEFTDFLPHVSIGPAGTASAVDVPVTDYMDVNYDSDYRRKRRNTLPASVYFDRLAICWGDERIVFSLGDFDY